MKKFKLSQNIFATDGRGKRSKTIVSLLLAMTLLFTTISVVASNRKDASSMGQSGEVKVLSSSILGVSLGQSGRAIHTVKELEELSKQVAQGQTFAGSTFILMENLHLGELEKWEPIGSAAHPFKGTFDGNNHFISGVGSATRPSLFGFLNEATVKDLTAISVRLVTERDPYYGLFIDAVKSTIINCQVINTPATLNRALMAASSFVPDSSWRASRQITKFEHLLDLDSMVQANPNDAFFGGGDIKIAISTAMTPAQAKAWKGIGSYPNSPFTGTIGSATIAGLSIDQGSAPNVGLFAYTQGATLNNIQLTNVNIKGGDNVGAIVGYAEDTVINDSYVTGSVSGALSVGGLVGYQHTTEAAGVLQDVIAGSAKPFITRSYSTADVNGSVYVGGLIGFSETEKYPAFGYSVDILNTAFSAGNVSGVVRVGGAVGHVESADVTTGVTFSGLRVRNVGVYGNIDGSKVIGGIVGSTSDNFSDGYDADYATVAQSYFAGTLTAFDMGGGLAGARYDVMSMTGFSEAHAMESYVSGKIIVANSYEEDNNWPFFGRYERSDSVNVWAGPNSIYEPTNIMNADPTRSTFEKGTGGSTPSINNSEHHYFTEPFTNIAGFGTASLSYSEGIGGVAETYVPDAGGRYPALSAFTTVTGPNASAFQNFSAITTSVDIVDLPDAVAVDPTTLTFNYPGIAHELALSASNGLTWAFSTGNTAKIADETLEGGYNNITLANTKVKADAPFLEDYEIMLKGGTASVPGFTINRRIKVLDTAVRPLKEGYQDIFYEDAAVGHSPASKSMIMDQSTYYINFPEKIALGGGGSVTLSWSNSPSFTPVGGSVTLNHSIINNMALRLAYQNDQDLKDAMGFDRYYKIELSSIGIEDTAASANGWEPNPVKELYFRTGSNSLPELTFSPSASNATSTTANNTKQTLTFIENPVGYGGILDYLESTHVGGQYVDVITDTSIATLKPGWISLGGTAGSRYPVAPTIANLHTIPGTYTVSYSAKDPDFPPNDPNVPMSVPIERTYQVSSVPHIEQGGKPYKLLSVNFSDIDMLEMTEISATKKITLQEALNQMIQSRYITNAQPNDKIESFYYDHTLTKQPLGITFDTSAVSDDAFVDGVEQVLYFTTGTSDKNHMFVLNLASSTPTREIILEENAYITENIFSKYQARAFFGARVFDKIENDFVFEEIIVDFSEVDRYKYDVAQDVTFTIASTKGKTIAGRSIEVSAKASVTIKKVLNKAEEDVNANSTFWNTAMNRVRDGVDDKTYNIELSYDNGIHAQTDFFRVVKNKENVTANLKYPSGIVLSMKSGDLDSTLIDEMIYNIAVERMYDMYVNRDAGSLPTQQFATDDVLTLPGTMTLSMPLDDALVGQSGLSLYRIDQDTNEYVLIQDLSQAELANDTLSLSMKEFQGRYVVTAADLAGKLSGAKPR